MRPAELDDDSTVAFSLFETAISRLARSLPFRRSPVDNRAAWRKDSFAAITTLGAKEYDVDRDCRRLGLHPFFPQQRKLWLPRGAQKPLLRASPLFPRYLLVPIAEARRRELHYVPGIDWRSVSLGQRRRPNVGSAGIRRLSDFRG